MAARTFVAQHFSREIDLFEITPASQILEMLCTSLFDWDQFRIDMITCRMFLGTDAEFGDFWKQFQQCRIKRL